MIQHEELDDDFIALLIQALHVLEDMASWSGHNSSRFSELRCKLEGSYCPADDHTPDEETMKDQFVVLIDEGCPASLLGSIKWHPGDHGIESVIGPFDSEADAEAWGDHHLPTTSPTRTGMAWEVKKMTLPETDG